MNQPPPDLPLSNLMILVDFARPPKTNLYLPNMGGFLLGPNATWHPMNGIGRPPPKTTPAQKRCEENHILSPATRKIVYYSLCAKIQTKQTFTRLNTKTLVLLVFARLCNKTPCNPSVPPEASANQFKHGLPPEITLDSLHRPIKLDKDH